MIQNISILQIYRCIFKIEILNFFKNEKGQAWLPVQSYLVVPHMSFPVIIRCLIIGEPDAGNILTVQDGEIGLLGDLAQLPVMVKEGRSDHNGEYSIRIFGFDLRFLSRGGLQQLVHAWDRIEDPILLSLDILIGSCITHNLSLLIVTHTRRHYSMEKVEQQDLTFPEKLFSDLQAYYPEDKVQ